MVNLRGQTKKNDAPSSRLERICEQISRVPDYRFVGKISAIDGLRIKIGGVRGVCKLGSFGQIAIQNRWCKVEVVALHEQSAIVMGFDDYSGVQVGAPFQLLDEQGYVYPHESWKGRVLDGFARPIDGKIPLSQGDKGYWVNAAPSPAHHRRTLGEKITTGVRVIDAFTPCCRGQRLGIFSGSGIGKSQLLSMIARFAGIDVIVIGLIGERGREVREFIEHTLGETGLARSVMVVATSDESALKRRQAARMTLTIAEAFRDKGQQVLLLFDSLTRLATAQREIGLAVGEPPANRGYTPSVFTELPRLLERSGPGLSGTKAGDVTAFFTVLVEGDDHNEPISDNVRAILDGHIVLSRDIANRHRYPAVDVLKSVSRALPRCATEHENAILAAAKRHVFNYERMRELIEIGAYRQGTDTSVDEAIRLHTQLESFCQQAQNESDSGLPAMKQLENIVSKASKQVKTP